MADMREVHVALAAALSPIASTRTPAENFLSHAEHANPAAYLSALLAVITHQATNHGDTAAAAAIATASVPAEVRTLACLALKNSCVRVWRGGGGGATAAGQHGGQAGNRARLRGNNGQTPTQVIQPEEKSQLRQAMLNAAITEIETSRATQLALALAKVARIDFPNNWPRLFHELAAAAGLGGGSQTTTHNGTAAAASASPTATMRGYLCVHHVLSELSTKRLSADRLAYTGACALLWPAAWEHWCHDMHGIIAHVDACFAGTTQETNAALVERWRLGLKVVRRLLLRGEADPEDDPDPNTSDARRLAEVTPILQSALEALIARRAAWRARSSTHPNALSVVLAWGPKKLLQTLGDAQVQYPHSSRRSVPGVLHVCFLASTSDDCLSADGGARIASLAMSYAREVASCSAYFSSSAWESAPTAATMHESSPTRFLMGIGDTEAAAADGGGGGGGTTSWRPFDVPTATQLIRAIIARHIALQSEDATSWLENAESYHHEQMSGGAGGSAAAADAQKCRASAEYLILSIVALHRDWASSPTLGASCGKTNHVAAMLTRELEEARAMIAKDASFGADGSPTETCMRLEAACAAVSACAYDLYDHVPFGSWLCEGDASILWMLALRGAGLGARALRRRACLAVAAWVADIPDESRAAVYAALLPNLVDADLAVSLAACHALNTLINDWGFNSADLLEGARAHIGGADAGATMVQALMGIVSRCEELDSHTLGIETLASLIDRLGPEAKPYCALLASVLPQAWALSAQQNILLRDRLLVVMRHTTCALGEASPTLHAIVLPAIWESTDPARPDDFLALAVEALRLWRAVLRSAPTASDDLLLLLPRLTVLAEMSTEHARSVLSLVESYVLLAGDAAFVGDGGRAICAVFHSMVGQLNDVGTGLMMRALELSVQAAPRGAVAALSGVLSRVIKLIASGDETDTVCGYAACVLSRVAFTAPEVGGGATGLAALASASGVTGAWPKVVAIWLGQAYAGMADAPRRRLLALGALVLIVQRDASAWSVATPLSEALKQAARESGELPTAAGVSVERSVSFELYDAGGSGDDADDEGAEVGRRAALFAQDPANAPVLSTTRQALASLGNPPELAALQV